MFRFYFSFLLVLAMCISGNAYAEPDLYTYTEITCRPDLQYLQIDAVTEDISEGAANAPSQFYVGEEGVTFCSWDSMEMSFFCDKEKVKNRYLTYNELRILLRANNAGGGEHNYTPVEEQFFIKNLGLEKRPAMTREKRIDYMIEEQHKGLKKPYQCKFNDKVVTIEEKISPGYPNAKCLKQNVSLLIFDGNELIKEQDYFHNDCEEIKVAFSFIYNNAGVLTECYGGKSGCIFYDLKKRKH